MAHEMIQSIDPVPIVLRVADRVANFLRQLCRNPFIRIEYKNPLVRCLRDCPILAVAARALLALDNPATELARNPARAIVRP